MAEIVEKFLGMTADIINKLFLFEIDFQQGQMIPIGKVITAFLFITFTIYFILDAMGILESRGEE